jgi:hypothetical protein
MASPSATALLLGPAFALVAGATALAADCNRNGTPDHEEIADGTLPDCDGNDVPDACDIAAVNFGLTMTHRLAVGRIPNQSRAADLDGDGHIDIATASDEGSMDFLWNNGAGGFHPVERRETPRFVLFMDLGDVDGDGRIDVVALTHNGLLFFMNQGSRRFAGRLDDRGRPRSLGLGDTDLDGDVDIALADPFEVIILTNPGDGMFPRGGRSLPVGSDPEEVLLTRVNGDEILDLVTANDPGGPSGNISILLGAGGGRFGLPRNYAVAQDPMSIAAGDLDGDGDADIVTASSSDDSLSILEGDGAGLFGAAVDIPLPDGRSSASLGDMDGDGRLDIACMIDGTLGPAVAVLINRGDASFPRPVEFPQEAVSLRPAMGDFDADGSLELAIPIRETGTVLVLGSAVVRYSPDCDQNGVPDGCELTGRDCNSNRIPDVCDVASGAGGDCNRNAIPDDCEPDCNRSGFPDDCDIALGTSRDCNQNGVPDECDLGPRMDFAASAPSAIRRLARSVEAADIDRDGHQDLVRVEPLLGLAVYHGRGDGTFEAPAVITEIPHVNAAAPADMDGDGDLDLAAGDDRDGRIRVFFQSAPRSFEEGGDFISSERVFPGALAPGDLDGDGDLDLAFSQGTNSVLAVAANDGKGVLRRMTVIVRVNPPVLHFTDLDGDGREDVLARRRDGFLVVLWNEGVWIGNEVLISGKGDLVDAAIADLDGDGDVDVAAATSEGFTIALKEETRSYRVIDVSRRERPLTGIAAADLDLDGDADLAMTSGDEDRPGILVFRNDATPSFGTPFVFRRDVGRLAAPIEPADFDGDGRVDLAVERERECPKCPEEPVTIALLNRALPARSADLDRDRVPDECERGSFRRGDAGGDGLIDLADAVLVLRALFQGGPAPGCAEAADANNDGRTDLADPVLVLEFLFQSGPPPAAPGPPPGPCGPDTDPAGSPGDLGCESYASC